jgi:hypothetical protein
MYVTLLYSSHRHVSTNYVAIFRAVHCDVNIIAREPWPQFTACIFYARDPQSYNPCTRTVDLIFYECQQATFLPKLYDIFYKLWIDSNT